MRTNRKLLAMALALVFLLTATTIPAQAVEEDLVVLHTNDIHGRIETQLDEDEPIMGIPIISTLIAEYREEHDNVLVMDAGDTIHGRSIANQLDGSSVVDTMNAAGYDVMVPGNHDFNFGYERLLELEEKMEFDLVAANVFKDGELLFEPYEVYEMEGYKVGVFGLATPDTYATTHPDNIEGIEFADMIEAADEYVAVLEDYDVDLIVALGHVGFAGDHPSTEVAEEVEGIDLFVDGHSHSRLAEGEWHHDTLFVQAYEYTKDLGVAKVNLDGPEPEFSASLISGSEATDIEPDEEIKELLDEASDQILQDRLGG